MRKVNAVYKIVTRKISGTLGKNAKNGEKIGVPSVEYYFIYIFAGKNCEKEARLPLSDIDKTPPVPI